MKLEGKVAIVSGGGGGLGRGITLCLAEEGADVAIVDFNGDDAKKVAGEVKALGRQSLAIEANVRDGKRVTELVQETIDTFGKIDILVNNVGGLGTETYSRTSLQFIDLKDAEVDEAFDRCLKTGVSMCRAVAPYFMKQRSGKIVNISSIAGKGHGYQIMWYGIAKGSVIQFTKSLAMELAEYNINVNAICPGVIYTAAQERLQAHIMRFIPKAKGMTAREYFDNTTVSRVPLGREQTAEDIGRLAVFLASEDARNITGQSINVDGGMVMS